MYRRNATDKTSIEAGVMIEGETIEAKIRRIVNNKEPITDGAPIVYTERKDGVLPQYDIRTDRFEIAVDAMDKVQKSNVAKRMQVVKDEKDGGAEPLRATGTDEKP